MVPARQRLEAAQATRRDVRDWLVNHVELPLGQRLAQIKLHRPPSLPVFGAATVASIRELVRSWLSPLDRYATISLVTANSSSSAFASCKSLVSKPSVNQP